ncbi:hypothetical protein JCM31598_19080 [Desulfonatronum parangueonense]
MKAPAACRAIIRASPREKVLDSFQMNSLAACRVSSLAACLATNPAACPESSLMN